MKVFDKSHKIIKYKIEKVGGADGNTSKTLPETSVRVDVQSLKRKMVTNCDVNSILEGNMSSQGANDSSTEPSSKHFKESNQTPR